MSIHGKKEGIFRILGSFLILLSLILSILFNILAINDLLLYLLFFVVVFPLFLISVLLKLEQDIVVKNSAKFLFLLVVGIIVINIIIFFYYSKLHIMRFVVTECSDLLLICCWHFSFSIKIFSRISEAILLFGKPRTICWPVCSALPHSLLETASENWTPRLCSFILKTPVAASCSAKASFGLRYESRS